MGSLDELLIGKAEQHDLARILAIQKQAYLPEVAIYEDWSRPPLRQTQEEIEAEFESKVFLKARLYERHGYIACREEALSPTVTLIYMQKSKAGSCQPGFLGRSRL